MKRIFGGLWNWIKRTRKIYFVLGGIAIYLSFFDPNSVFKNYLLDRRINELEQKIAEEEQKMKENEERLFKVLEDKYALEHYAREKYRMKAKDEDIYLIEE